jgi:DNA invertase Pin-like site-specific DNA recombinase
MMSRDTHTLPGFFAGGNAVNNPGKTAEPAQHGAPQHGAIVAYYRVSTDKQGRSGLGLEAQRHAVHAYAASVGARIAREFVEVETGKRASLSNRPELRAALMHCKRARATLCIAKLDRLARNVHFLSGLMESRVAFVACDNPHATPLTLHILAAVAEAEAAMISQRVRDGLAALRSRGKVFLGHPGGVPEEAAKRGRIAGGEAVRRAAVEDYEHVIEEVVRWRAEGVALQGIADRLNERGELTRGGASWTPVQVHRVLKRAKVAVKTTTKTTAKGSVNHG